MKDYYLILELTSDATSAQIKASYRDKIRFYHPDRWRDDPTMHQRAEERTREINEAYQTLIDPASRAEYDRKSPQSSAPRPQRPQAWARPEPVDVYADVARRDAWQDTSHRRKKTNAEQRRPVSTRQASTGWFAGIMMMLIAVLVLIGLATDRVGPVVSIDVSDPPARASTVADLQTSLPTLPGFTLETVLTPDIWCDQQSFCEGAKEVYAAEWSPEKDTLAILNANRSITLWNNTTQTVEHILTNPCAVQDTTIINWRALSWSPDGSMLAAGGDRDSDINIVNTLAVWDTATWTIKQCIIADNVESLTWSPDSQYVARSGASNATQIKIWNTDDGSVALGIDGTAQGRFVRWSPGGRFLAYDDSGRVVFREVATSTNIDPFDQPWATFPNENPTALEWSPDADKVAVRAGESKLYILSKVPGTVLFQQDFPNIKQLAWAPDSKKLAVTGGQSLVLIDSGDGAVSEQLFEQPGMSGTPAVTDYVSWSSDWQYLAVVIRRGDESSIWIWKVQIF